MRRGVALVGVALVLSSCSASTSPTAARSSTTSPPTASSPSATAVANPLPRPSKGCGGYHIVIDNKATAEIRVRINGELVTSAKPGHTADIAQWGSFPVPAMPWDVEVTRASDKKVLLVVHLDNDGTDGRRVQVADRVAAGEGMTSFTC